MATFYIEALEATTITLSKVGSPTFGDAVYGINNTSPSTAYTYGTNITLSAGQKCYWTITKTTTAFTTSKYLKFTSTGRINVGGNLGDLIGGETKIPRNFCFYRLFYQCTKLVDASNLVMVNNFNSKTYCYSNMFEGCTSLTSAPQLSATTLTTYCYQYMFSGCTSLTSAPQLPATTLANYCYDSMFQACRSLTSAPELPATTLANYCYRYMFANCTALTSPPELPATTLAMNCYSSMFSGCESLTTAPELPVTTLNESGCYEYMFSRCTSLTSAPQLPATTLAYNCYGNMFSGCTSLTSAPELPATTLTDTCYRYMFANCTALTSPPELPATTLANNCYNSMFSGCTSIKLSTTQTGNYQIPYRIPSSGTGTEGTNSLTNMFTSTGGTFTGAPTINTTYYLYQKPPATFYIEALESTTITLSKVGSPTVGPANYGINDTSVPNSYTLGTNITLSAGQKCYWTITSTTSAFSSSNYLNFTSTGKINAGGNLSDLIGGEDKIPRNFCFYRLFYQCTKLVDASNLVMVNDFNAKTYCYNGMFYSCTSLTSAPQLPATTLTHYCYQYMFSGCTSLTAPPELPATSLTTYCYGGMFNGCTNIKLSTTQTGNYQIPYRIPSSGTGTEGSYSLNTMFTGTGGTFTGTPTINTTYYLYQKPPVTFYIEALESTTITLLKVGSPTVGTANYGINDTSVPNSYNYGDSITLSAGQKCYWTITSTTTAFTTSKYLKFTSTGRINVGGNLGDLIGGETKIPRNYCFYGLFYECTKLVDASNLVMVNNFNSKTYCYSNMFEGCTSLTSAPQLSATTLAENCYRSMFSGCTSLTSAPQLPATTLANYCYYNMFYNCTSLTTAPQLPATTLANYCYYCMFYKCTNIKLSTTQTGNYQIPYRIPSSGTGTAGTNSLTSMFASTGGTFTGTPTINTTYYMPYPVSITYNGNFIAGMENGSKTLNCSSKYMNGNVVVTADKPVDITYNGTKIVSSATGTKTLNCANKTMSGNVVVTVK